MVKDIHVYLEDHENILINVEYLINTRYVCFRCNLSGKVDAVEGSHRGHLPSAIYSTKAKTLEVSMTEKFHRQKISFMDRNFIQSPYDPKKEVKNRWKK